MTNYEYFVNLPLIKLADLLTDIDHCLVGPDEGETWEEWLKEEYMK